MPGHLWDQPGAVMRVATTLQVAAGVLIALVLFGGMRSAPESATATPTTGPPATSPSAPTTTVPEPPPPSTTTLPPPTTTVGGETIPESRGAEPQPQATPPAVPPPPTVAPTTVPPPTTTPPTTTRAPRNKATGLPDADDLEICVYEQGKNLIQRPCSREG